MALLIAVQGSVCLIVIFLLLLCTAKKKPSLIVKQNDDTTGTWVTCETLPPYERCGKCHLYTAQLYYRQDKPGSTTGDYWCRECAEKTGQPIIMEE